MKGLQLLRQNTDLSGLAVAELPAPTPGPGELLIQVAAVSASKLELEQTIAGVGLGRAVSLPRVLGMDPAGAVIAVGPDVAKACIGRRVAVKPNLVCGTCRYCATGQESDCLRQQVLGVHRDGGAAELVTVPAAAAFDVPPGMDYGTAAATVHTVAVAVHLLRAAGAPSDSAAVLVLGASGAVGSAAVQLAAHAGAQVTAAVSSADKAEQSTADGAGHIVDATRPDALAAAVRQHAVDGVSAVIDAAGDARLLTAAIDALGWRGIAVSCAGRPGLPVRCDLAALYRSRRTVRGVGGTDYDDVRAALAAVASGAARPRVAASFDLDRAVDAYRVLADRGTPGKVLLTP